MKKQPAPLSDVPDFGFLIYDIGRQLRSLAMENLGQMDMTEAQWRTIAFLGRMEGCRQADLAQALQVRPITLARVIDKLEAAHLVRRQPDDEDRRAFLLYLTADAKILLEAMEAMRAELHGKALAKITKADRHHLIELLRMINQNLSKNFSLGELKEDQFRGGQIKGAPIKKSQVKKSQVKKSQVKKIGGIKS